MNTGFFRIFFSIAVILCTVGKAHAQFETVYIGVNGLTCSQCSRTVEMRIRKLDFVSDVQMNLEHTEGTILLKKDRKPDIEKIAQSVVDAGFSVRYVGADVNFGSAINGSCASYKGDQYVFVQPPKNNAKGVIKVKFLGKKYQPKNEFKKMEPSLVSTCGATAGNVYYISEDNK